MKTQCFDAAVDFPFSLKKKNAEAQLFFSGQEISASLNFYPQDCDSCPEFTFVQIFTSQPFPFKWRDDFWVSLADRMADKGRGIVLDPQSEKVSLSKMRKRVDYLRQLTGGEKDMILALSQEKGIKGLGEKEIVQFSRVAVSVIVSCAQELEEEGVIRIITFSPLFLLAQSCLDYLCRIVLSHIEKVHRENPDRIGMSLEEIREKFGLHPKVITLVLKVLDRDKKIEPWENRFVPAGFNAVITAEEEKLLREMEVLSLKGELKTVSLEEMRGLFSLSKAKLNKLLALLVERKKVVQGKDGFILHSKWLDDIISRIQDSGKRELSVPEFKRMTGLTRKYAIPLLELLDQLGVTRRKGSSREILR